MFAWLCPCASLCIVKRATMYCTISAWHAEDVSWYPRTVVAYSEFDFLRCQNERWARRLQDAGVSVRCVRYCGCDHGFLERFGTMPQAEDFINVAADEILRAFNPVEAC